jgi:hypothetical protein
LESDRVASPFQCAGGKVGTPLPKGKGLAALLEHTCITKFQPLMNMVALAPFTMPLLKILTASVSHEGIWDYMEFLQGTSGTCVPKPCHATKAINSTLPTTIVAITLAESQA